MLDLLIGSLSEIKSYFVANLTFLSRAGGEDSPPLPPGYASARVTRHTANTIDHISTSSVIDHNDFKSAIIKTDLLDHFPIVFVLKTNETTQKLFIKSTYKRPYL